MKVTSECIKSNYDKSNAVEHYLSKDRRDGVKVEWEEPFSCSVFKKAIRLSHKIKKDKLKVLDIGSGTGDGYELLKKLFKEYKEISNYQLEYLGIDISPQMVKAANDLYAKENHVRFKCEDIRHSNITDFFDVYLSCGVPYSHLTNDELYQAIKTIVTNVRKYNSRCAVVVDVLGRYSIEWTPKWNETRWDYSMSFFESEGHAEPTWMSFYSHDDLQNIMQKAADAVGCPVERFQFFDRSIMVGRHTSTGQFNPKLPNYRNLINSLMEPGEETELNKLIFQVELTTAPKHILEFFEKFSGWWNLLVSQAGAILGESIEVELVDLPQEVQGFKAELDKEFQQISGKDARRQKVELMLAQVLQKLEATQQPGYGVGHDLFGVMWLDARGLDS
ncbi:Methyltransferase type 12 [Trichodesmium erythraeum IMS101]|uniref:Methyltransferase type 12 n=1 Tax=Trichodesmium erythraeum (strain IMS101) TaxID=203124 RepID=Q114N9_TRIEI|nr:class I SAM-dependent methyltransferase [Trichodesmium erythraeum GBRTRLIN201]MCH2050615.1 class I SAM-dependent methyltransferase [Trichodesmium sp. ALOHA_ZT_67]MDT9340568.1 class I SAM-dependent methyltransferase [Trichodesmium erythraeum 21-75]